MYGPLTKTIHHLQTLTVPEERLEILQALIDYLNRKRKLQEPVHLNFICTHNSRRSQLAQIWAQTAAAHYKLPQVHCYSGGTETTALFPQVVETLRSQGFQILQLSENLNPVYVIKYDSNGTAIIGFSKKYNHPINPENSFAAIMTCSQADDDCPIISGAEKRIPLNYLDPKISDGTLDQINTYAERSLEIASEMFYVFSRVGS